MEIISRCQDCEVGLTKQDLLDYNGLCKSCWEKNAC